MSIFDNDRVDNELVGTSVDSASLVDVVELDASTVNNEGA